jgi:hypothetical protein
MTFDHARPFGRSCALVTRPSAEDLDGFDRDDRASCLALPPDEAIVGDGAEAEIVDAQGALRGTDQIGIASGSWA